MKDTEEMLTDMYDQGMNQDLAGLQTSKQSYVDHAMSSGVGDLFRDPNVIKRYLKDFVDNPLMDEKDTKLNRLWAFLGRTTKLTYLNKEDKEIIYHYMFDINKIDVLIGLHKWEYNQDVRIKINQVELEFNNAVNGAVGTKDNIMNVRNSITSATNVSMSNSSYNHGQKTGWRRFF